MKHKLSTCLYWILTVAPFAVSGVFYSRVPDRVAVHWDINGQANGFASKQFGLFALPTILLGSILLVNVVFAVDPKHQNIDRSPQMKQLVRWFLVILSNAMNLFTILSALNYKFDMSTATMLLVGIFIALTGNYLPKCKYNYSMGIRLPWTLASEENWRKTHRFASVFWILGGILIAVSGFFHWPWAMISSLVFLVALPVVYSFLLYRKEQKGNG